jgi:hypothetical protein
LLRKSIVDDGQRATTAADLNLYSSRVPSQQFEIIDFISVTYAGSRPRASHAVPAASGTNRPKIVR